MSVPDDLQIRGFPDAAGFDTWLTTEHDRCVGISRKFAESVAGVPVAVRTLPEDPPS